MKRVCVSAFIVASGLSLSAVEVGTASEFLPAVTGAEPIVLTADINGKTYPMGPRPCGAYAM